MNKQKINYHLPYILRLFFAALILLSVLITIYFITHHDKYNPEIHDCDELTTVYDATCTSCAVVQPIGSECIKWHKKSKCELDPNAEGCVCDEQTYRINNNDYLKFNCELYTQDKITYEFCLYTNSLMDNYRVCIKSHEAPTPIKIDLNKEKCIEHTDENVRFWDKELNTWNKAYCSNAKENCEVSNKCEFYDQYCCIKKEPKTPCELGDKDYILESKLLEPASSWYNEIFVSYICQPGEVFNNLTIKCESSICRSITVYDYDCSILMENILKDNGYCGKSNKFTHSQLISACGQGNYLYKSDLVDIAKEKGCLK